MLVFAKRPGGTEDRIDQRGLAVINMGHDGQVANVRYKRHTATDPLTALQCWTSDVLADVRGEVEIPEPYKYGNGV
ncbi:MAG: hypothetical protein Kow0074_16190 [Candidatus Zixiibacteriota bacterium]